MREGFHLWKTPFLAPLNCTAGVVFRWVHFPTALEWVRKGWGGTLSPTRTSAGLVSWLPGMLADPWHSWRNCCKAASPRSACIQAGWLFFPPSLQHFLHRFFFLWLGHLNQPKNHVLCPWEGQQRSLGSHLSCPCRWVIFLPQFHSDQASWALVLYWKQPPSRTRVGSKSGPEQNQWLKLVFFICKSPACQQGLGILFIFLKKLFMYLFMAALGLSSHAQTSLYLWHADSREQTHVPCIAKWILNHWTTREVPLLFYFLIKCLRRDALEGI